MSGTASAVSVGPLTRPRALLAIFLRNHTKRFSPFWWTQNYRPHGPSLFSFPPPTIPTRLSVTNGIVSRADRDPAVGMVGLSRSYQPTCLGLGPGKNQSSLSFFFLGRCPTSVLSCHTSRKGVLITMWRALRRLRSFRFVVRISGSFWNEYYI